MTENNGLPQGWDWVPLGEIVEDVVKVQPKENPDQEFVYLDISSIDNSQFKIVSPKHYLGKEAPSRARQLVKAGDILFSTVRTYLKNIAQVPHIYDNQIASTGFCVIRPKSPLNKDFYFYLTLTDQFINPLSKIQRGTSYPAVRNSDVLEQYVPVPPPPERERIVAKIEELFTQLEARVAELQQAKAQLQRYRQAVLKSAVEGELTREWRVGARRPCPDTRQEKNCWPASCPSAGRSGKKDRRRKTEEEIQRAYSTRYRGPAGITGWVGVGEL